MKIILILNLLLFTYFFLKKKIGEIIKDTNDMVMCGNSGFHFLKKIICRTESQIKLVSK